MTREVHAGREVFRIDEGFAGIEWPKLEKIAVPDLCNGDCLIVCAGFEDRAPEALKRISSRGVSGMAVGLIRYLPKSSHNKTARMYRMCREISDEVELLTYDRESPAGFGDRLKDFAGPYSRVVVDISGMSRLMIVQVLVALLSDLGRDVVLIYIEAGKYLPSKEQFERDKSQRLIGAVTEFPTYLSSGIFEIVTTPELGSVAMLGAPIRLVAFPSFDPTQLANLLQELQPTHMEIVHGVPGDAENRWRTNAIRELNSDSLKQIGAADQHEVSTLDYRRTLDLLLQIYDKVSAYNRLVLTPTGSKMQAVAIGIFRAAFDDVQIVYPTPQTFVEPKKYTDRVGQLYQVVLPQSLMARAFHG